MFKIFWLVFFFNYLYSQVPFTRYSNKEENMLYREQLYKKYESIGVIYKKTIKDYQISFNKIIELKFDPCFDSLYFSQCLKKQQQMDFQNIEEKLIVFRKYTISKI